MTQMINTMAGGLSNSQVNQANLLDSRPKEIVCGTCRLKFNDVPSFKLHRSTEFHVYNTKRQMA